MIRIVTAAALGLFLLLIASSIVAFVTGWWIIGIAAVVLAIAAGMFTLAGMSLIALESIDA